MQPHFRPAHWVTANIPRSCNATSTDEGVVPVVMAKMFPYLANCRTAFIGSWCLRCAINIHVTSSKECMFLPTVLCTFHDLAPKRTSLTLPVCVWGSGRGSVRKAGGRGNSVVTQTLAKNCPCAGHDCEQGTGPMPIN